MMTNNRELAAVFGVLVVAWIVWVFTSGAAGQCEMFTCLPVFIPTVLVLIFTPAVMSKARWTALGAVIAGVVAIIVSILGITGGEGYVPAVALVLSLLFTYFSFRAYRQK
jgi:peptidoglycan/LPS O-acetylase OafA/YrhL